MYRYNTSKRINSEYLDNTCEIRKNRKKRSTIKVVQCTTLYSMHFGLRGCIHVVREGGTPFDFFLNL